MIKIENTEVYGWDAAIRGMRNPLNSWSKSDTTWGLGEDRYADMVIGEKDLKLMKNLSKAGEDHGKFLRMITVTVDITAPLYWWKEADTYKVGTVANSCSTMHKIHARELNEGDFSFEYVEGAMGYKAIEVILDALEFYRGLYLETKDMKYWRQMIQLLPSSYNQKRTVQLNYQVLKSMYFARRNHKLDEWRNLCDWMLTLPYFKEICVDCMEGKDE